MDEQGKTFSEMLFESGAGWGKVKDIYDKTSIAYDELGSRGFRQLDAVDGSEGMLREAARKKVYTQLLCAMVTDQPLDLPPDSYDGAVTAGSMGNNHLPASALKEMVRLVKPGGYIIMAFREEFVNSYNEELDRMFQQLEHDGKWKMESRDTYAKHYEDYQGALYVFRVL